MLKNQISLAPIFVGRNSELMQLNAALKHGKMVLLTGDAGVGKTTLANHYAHCQEKHPVLYSWETINTKHTFENSNHKNSLIVIDDVPFLSESETKTLLDILDKLIQCNSVIVISRYPPSLSITTIVLRGINMEESLELFNSLLSKTIEREKIIELFNWSMGNPVAIKTLASMLNESPDKVDETYDSLFSFNFPSLFNKALNMFQGNSIGNVLQNQLKLLSFSQREILIDLCALGVISKAQYLEVVGAENTEAEIRDLENKGLVSVEKEKIFIAHSLFTGVVWETLCPIWDSSKKLQKNMLEALSEKHIVDESLYERVIQKYINNDELFEFIQKFYKRTDSSNQVLDVVMDNFQIILASIEDNRKILENQSKMMGSVKQNIEKTLQEMKKQSAEIENANKMMESIAQNSDRILLEIENIKPCIEEDKEKAELLNEIHEIITNKRAKNVKRLLDILGVFGSAASIAALPQIQDFVTQILFLIQ